MTNGRSSSISFSDHPSLFTVVCVFSGGRLHTFSYQAQAGRQAVRQQAECAAEDSVERDLSPPPNNNCDRWCCGGRRKRKSKVHRSLKWMLAGAAAASVAVWWKAVGVVGVGAIVLEDLHHHPTPKLDKSISSFMMIWTESPGSDQHK